jgi:hypothetical protein
MALTVGAAFDQFRHYVDFLYQYGLFPRQTPHKWQEREVQEAFVASILRGKRPRLAGYRFSVESFRSLTGQEFQAVLAVDSSLRRAGPLTAFVGHRFIDAVTHNLRHNLLTILREYGIRPVYADSDVPNGPLFTVILRRIHQSHFCIFDDRMTEARPNVFIELGAALAWKRPYFYLHYDKPEAVRVGRRREQSGLPSDLAGMLYLRYSTYQELIRQFATWLPRFLTDRKLAAATRA